MLVWWNRGVVFAAALVLALGCSESDNSVDPGKTDSEVGDDSAGDAGDDVADSGGTGSDAVADTVDDSSAADAGDDAVADTGSDTGSDTAVGDASSDTGTGEDGDASDSEGDTTDPDGDATGDVGKVCTFGETQCSGAKLATCGPFEDGWIETNCFPGLTCNKGTCVPVSNNLIIAFDTSGSMTGKVTGCTASGQAPPDCDPTKGCTRMDISKQVFTQALSKIDDKVTRMALFRFPQKLYYKTSLSCTTGFYQGQSKLSTDPGTTQGITPSSSWFWDELNETACVGFPKDAAFESKQEILKWMDGTEVMVQQGTCSNSSTTCKPVPGCAGTCCSGKCYVHTDPELRPTGGTPIGRTLFYIGEYLRNSVVIDGKACSVTADCGNVNYICKDGVCKDPARSCRETIVVLFTDGGESNSATNYFAPWVQAKRMAYGLGCQADSDCVGGTVDDPIVCKSGKCLPKFEITGYYCSKDMAACLPSATKGEPTYCEGECVEDPRETFNPNVANANDNVLRSPDGKPFGVRVYVVDISGAASMKNSMSLAISGNGKLLGADAADPDKFLATLESVFDIKNKKVCGADF